MFSNYLKIAWRNIIKNRIYSLINIIGLTLGLTLLMLIIAYVKDDLSFDKMHAKGDRIYRLVQDRVVENGGISKMGNTGLPQGAAFKSELPEVVEYCRFKNGWNTLVKKGNEGIQQNLMYVDNSIFDIFSFKVLEGNRKSALNGISNVVITDEMAKKYFAGENAIGQTLYIGDEGSDFKTYLVTAVVKKPPINSSIQFDMLMSSEHLISKDSSQRANDANWYNASLNTFLLIAENADVSNVENKMKDITSKYLDKSEQSNPPVFRLQALHKMHLDEEYYATNGLVYWSDKKYPMILSTLGLIIILIACINFINLSLAQSLKRVKEIGIRKTIGSNKKQLIMQFLTESILITSISFLPSFVLARLILPKFCELTNKYLEPSTLYHFNTLLLYFGLFVIVVLMAGLYPSLVLSKFRPIESLKGQFKIEQRSSLNKGLVVFQFSIASLLIIGTIISSRQLSYINNTNVGYKTENIIRFWLPWEKIEEIATPLKDDLKSIPYVKNVSSKSGDWNSTVFTINGKKTEYVYYEDIDENHMQLMGYTVVKGRYLSKQFGLDTVSNVLVNESFINTNIPKGMDPFTTPMQSGNQTFNIVGVIKDFHYASFKEEIKPILWFMDRGGQAGCVHIEIDGKNKDKALASIREVYKKYVPYLPIEYQFLDEFRMEKYGEELLWKKIFDFTSIIAILIACLGLLGLVTFMSEQKSKEIGIRKVLGAGIIDIFVLMSRQFMVLVAIGICIAIPLSYFLAQKQLSEFVYREELSWWIFAVGALIIVSIALITLSIQSLKAAMANPIKSLKTE
jgi:putative ABC transport system permease protein